MKKLNILVATLMFAFFTSVKAEIQFGLGLIAGQTSVSGSETEGSAADTSSRSASFDEAFVGGDIFIEMVQDSGFTYGVSYVPLDIEIGSGSRVDSDGDDAAENDDGTRTASADLSDLVTVYANIPLGGNGFYGLVGAHMVTVTTSETLNESSYGNEDIHGYQLGIGQRSGNFKYEFAYSDFEDISLSATGGGTNSISADADAVTFRMSYGF
tara:strand:+ start:909 stop:1544 length:636 start_codon:yes stop_codon:yes gene_type:complete